MGIKKSIMRSVSAFVAFMVIGGYSQSTITFNVSGANEVVPPRIYGVLMEKLGRQWTGTNSSGIFVGTNSSIPNTKGMRKDIIDGFKECGVTVAEWPGGCAANGFQWQNNKRPANDVGVDRFIEFCRLTGAEAVIVGKPNASDAPSNLAFCQYIVDSLKYPLKWFKVGNEVWGCGGSQSVTTYTSSYSANYDRMKDYFNVKKVKMVASIDYAGPNHGDAIGWMNQMLQNLSGKIDGLEIHDYLLFKTNPGYSSTDPTTEQYWDIVNRAYNGQIGRDLSTIVNALNQKDPQNHVKLIFDEWGDWLLHTGDGWMQQNTVMDALSAGEHLHIFMKHSNRIEVAGLAQAVNVIHSLMNINTNGVMVKTPTFYVFKMFIPHHTNGAKMAPITASNWQNVNNIQAVTAFASVDTLGMVNISFTNVDKSATHAVTVTLTSSATSYCVKSAEVITGNEINSCNEFGQGEQVNIKTLNKSSYNLDGKTLSVTLPSKSVVMIRLELPVSAQPVNMMEHAINTFTVKAGPGRTVVVFSSAGSMKTPVTVCLYGLDGRTLIDRVSTKFDGGNNICILGNTLKRRGVYLVRISGDNLDFTQRLSFTGEH